MGCSTFGLNDSIAFDGHCNSEFDYKLADVLLPSDISGIILTKQASKLSRLDTGLPWPLEARVRSGEYIRRVPVSVIWRSLVEAEDSPARWLSDHELSFPLTRLLGKYIQAQVKASEYKATDRLLVAIPNDLDEYGQDCLLRDLKGLGYAEPILIWRPVATALSWLEKTQKEFIENQISKHDHIHIIYIGPDAVEFTTFELQAEERSGEFFVIPRRNRNQTRSDLAGVDWAGVVIESYFDQIDEGTFWQIFCQFPEIWAVLADTLPIPNEKERLLGHRDGWESWNPNFDLIKKLSASAVPAPCNTLRNLLKQSCKFFWPATRNKSTNWHLELGRQLGSLLDGAPAGRLRGMVVCGPLAPCESPVWIEIVRDRLLDRGLNLDNSTNQPRVDGLWFAPGSSAIAYGASLYGQRLDDGKPTYKDTLPTLSVRVRDGWRYKWFPLIDSTEVEGGQSYERKWKNRFLLAKDKRELTVHLKRGTYQETAPGTTSEAANGKENGAHVLTHCSQRIIRAAVKAGWNVEEIKNVKNLGDVASVSEYWQSFSQSFWDAQHADGSRSSEEETKSLLRSFTFSFPLPPPSDMRVDTVVKIKPASGFATVELMPEDPAFLQGRQVFLNFERMDKVDSLPRERCGWPEIDELCVDPEDPILRSKKSLKPLELLETTDIFKNRSDTWCKPIEKMLKSTTKLSVGKKKSLVCYSLDKDGNACTPEANALIARIADKLASHFDRLYHQAKDPTDFFSLRACYPKLFDLVMAGSLLFLKTPPFIVSFVRDVLNGSDKTLDKWHPFEAKQKLFFVAAGRCFSTPEDYRVLFKSVCDRITMMPPPGNFTIQSAGGCLGLLKLRSNAPDGLDPLLANILIQTCLTWLEHEDPGKKLQAKFFRVIRLMLYLLRMRERDENFLDPDSSETKDILHRFSTFMDDAVKNRVVKDKKEMALQVKDGFVSYVNYEGTSETVETLRLLSGEDTDD